MVRSYIKRSQIITRMVYSAYGARPQTRIDTDVNNFVSPYCR